MLMISMNKDCYECHDPIRGTYVNVGSSNRPYHIQCILGNYSAHPKYWASFPENCMFYQGKLRLISLEEYYSKLKTTMSEHLSELLEE